MPSSPIVISTEENRPKHLSKCLRLLSTGFGIGPQPKRKPPRANQTVSMLCVRGILCDLLLDHITLAQSFIELCRSKQNFLEPAAYMFGLQRLLAKRGRAEDASMMALMSS
jgi:hypothetical protein